MTKSDKRMLKILKDLTSKKKFDDPQNLTDCLYVLNQLEEPQSGQEYAKKVKIAAQKNATREHYDIYRTALLFEARYLFDSFCLYMEMDREPDKRFYLPRRKQLKVIVNGLQELSERKLDALFISQPPRTGKSTLCSFYLAFEAGRKPEGTNLGIGYGASLAKSFYDGVYELMTSPDYKYADIFPSGQIVDTNSKDTTINCGKPTKYKTLTCRSVDGALNGACDCDNLLYGDDLVSGIEEALSPERMSKKWFTITNNLLTRQKHTAVLLFVGTRWGLDDPIGRMNELYATDDHYKSIRYKVINVPALNENDESNFDYDYEVGFSTEDYKRQRATMDEASWSAQFQGLPLDRMGRLFNEDDLKYYNGVLPDGEPDRIVAPVDVAWGGSDSLSMPIGYQYGRSVYVADVVFNNGDKSVTRPAVKAKMIKHRPNETRFEANNGGHEYADIVDKELRDKGVRLFITSRTTPSTSNKLTRILIAAPDIIDHYYFIDPRYQSVEYRAFMTELKKFSHIKKNKHDDAPDSLAMMNDMLLESQPAEPFSRKKLGI